MTVTSSAPQAPVSTRVSRDAELLVEAAEFARTVAMARCAAITNCRSFLPHHKRCESCPQNVGDEIAEALLKDWEWWMRRPGVERDSTRGEENASGALEVTPKDQPGVC